jgi:hypothetical protein
VLNVLVLHIGNKIVLQRKVLCCWYSTQTCHLADAAAKWTKVLLFTRPIFVIFGIVSLVEYAVCVNTVSAMSVLREHLKDIRNP